MAQDILVTEQIKPGLAFLRKFDRYAPVKVAFWVKTEQKDRPYLYIASDAVTPAARVDAYREVYRLAGEMGWAEIDPTVIHLIGGDDPRVADAASLQPYDVDAYPRTLGPRRLGSRTAEDVYVYPPLSARSPAVALAS